jgi:hypothetical protein
MKTSIRSALAPVVSLALSAALPLGLAAGCGDAGTLAASEDADYVGSMTQSLVSTTGITARATYQEVVTGTPTYGFPATSPVLTVSVEVDDAALRKSFPSFDGLERAFVRVPKLQAGRLVWESVDLRYSGQTRRGYFAEIPIDLHDSGSIWSVDWATLQANGVALGLTTNLGVIWAQEEGRNLAVVRR